MQTIDSALPTKQQLSTPNDDPNPRAGTMPSTEPLRQSVGDRLFERMASLYGHRWVSQYGAAFDGIAADTWGAALSGVTNQQIADGLRSCVAEGDEWPPSAPRFRSMCFGIPSFAAVKLARQRGEWTAFGTLVWQHLDAYAYRLAEIKAGDRMLREAYEIAREHVLTGGRLPERVPEIEHRAPTKPVIPTDAETRAEILRKAREAAGIRDTDPPPNPPSQDAE